MKGFGRTRDLYGACLVSQMPPALYAFVRAFLELKLGLVVHVQKDTRTLAPKERS